MWHHLACMSLIWLALYLKLTLMIFFFPKINLRVFMIFDWDSYWGRMLVTKMVLIFASDGMLTSLSLVLLTLSCWQIPMYMQ